MTAYAGDRLVTSNDRI